MRLYRGTILEADSLTEANYRGLAEFRYRVRCFLRFSEQAARTAGVEPQQHQLLLAIKGLPEGKKATIGTVAERLQIQHHSAVELIDRLVERGLIRRYRSQSDRRQVFVRLTTSGEKVLRNLSLYHLQELQAVGPSLVKVFNELILNAHAGGRRAWLEELDEPIELPVRKKAKSR